MHNDINDAKYIFIEKLVGQITRFLLQKHREQKNKWVELMLIELRNFLLPLANNDMLPFLFLSASVTLPNSLCCHSEDGLDAINAIFRK